MKRLSLLLVVFVSYALAQEEQSKMRTWTSNVGTKIEAELVSTTGKYVTLKTEAGRTLKVALNKLSASDRSFIQGIPPAVKSPEEGAYPGSKVHPRSKEEMKLAMMEMRKHADEQSAFTEEERNACYYLNVYRYLAGLYHETELDRSLCDAAVKAATGCEELGKLDHDVNPEAGKCNLSGHGSIPDSIHGYMNDSGASNREHRAHRAWCLSPKLGKLGVGVGENERFCAMWTMDRSASSRMKSEFFAYPCPGYFPVSYLNENTAWTVYFPGAEMPAKGEIEVEVYEVSNAPEKILRHGDVPEGGRALDVNYVSLSKWVTPCVNFEPSATIKKGKKYWVSIKGGAFKAAYFVEFLSL